MEKMAFPQRSAVLKGQEQDGPSLGISGKFTIQMIILQEEVIIYC